MMKIQSRILLDLRQRCIRISQTSTYQITYNKGDDITNNPDIIIFSATATAKEQNEIRKAINNFCKTSS